jgi:cell division protein FtsL
MSYSTTYNRGHYAQRRSSMGRNQNTTRFVSNIKLGPVTHTVLVALMITVLGLIYLTQATKATSYDYQAQRIDSQIAELSEEKTDLEVENARLTALSTVRESSVAKAMTKSEAPAYVSN